MGIVIDTSALVDIERRGVDLNDALSKYGDHSIAFPAIVWAELLVGVRMADSADTSARRRANLEQLRLHVPIIEFGPDIAEHYADIFSECSKQGGMVPQNDIAVAATARYLGHNVLVGGKDEIHFRSIRDLAVITLFSA